jgi:hypothetical protein
VNTGSGQNLIGIALGLMLTACASTKVSAPTDTTDELIKTVETWYEARRIGCVEPTIFAVQNSYVTSDDVNMSKQIKDYCISISGPLKDVAPKWKGEEHTAHLRSACAESAAHFIEVGFIKNTPEIEDALVNFCRTLK